MGWARKLMVAALSLLLMFGFIQLTGNYLIGQLNNMQDTGQVIEQPVEEQVVRQMVLQLEPMPYYTFQIGCYQDASAGQAKINELAKLGYRVFVSQGPPFCLWLGCLGQEPQVDILPDVVRESSSDVFVQRLLLNETALRFPATDGQEMEQVSALLSSYDVVLKHSLRMFQDYRYAACDASNWAEMVKQISSELDTLQETGSALLTDAVDESLASGVLDLLTVTADYADSLQLMQEKQNDKVVLLAQSCLLELIAQYHSFMDQESQHEN